MDLSVYNFILCSVLVCFLYTVRITQDNTPDCVHKAAEQTDRETPKEINARTYGELPDTLYANRGDALTCSLDPKLSSQI